MFFSPRLRTALFLCAQIAPPLLMFGMALRYWDPVVTLFAVPVALYSAGSMVWQIRKKQYRLLLRPVLTVTLSLAIAAMGSYYAEQSVRYVQQLARDMQTQCNRDGICRLPPGEWEAHGKTMFTSHAPGPVHLVIILTVNEYVPRKKAVHAKGHRQPRAPQPSPAQPQSPTGQFPDAIRFTAFHIDRLLQAHDYSAHGGVGRLLDIPGVTDQEPPPEDMAPATRKKP